jgi:hypothetical protein
MIEGILYSYYWLYFNILREGKHSYYLPIMALSFLQGIAISSLLQIIISILFCYSVHYYYWLALLVLLNAMNFWLYGGREKMDEIITKSKAKGKKVHVIAIIFTAVSFALFFWSGEYVAEVLSNCR